MTSAQNNAVLLGEIGQPRRRMTDEERQADYEKSASQLWRWHSAAENLREAAAYLRSVHDNAMKEIAESKGGSGAPEGFYMEPPAHYLEGKCIELYLKCLLIKLGTKVTQDGAMTPKMKSHDLRKFCRKAGFDVSLSECQTLRKLTEAVTFWGTYPIPLHFDRWRPKAVGIEGALPPIWFWTQEDTENYTQIVSRLLEKIGPIDFDV